MNIQITCPTEINQSKWELANLMAGGAGVPKQALEALFEGIMKGFKLKASPEISTDLQDKIWTKISPIRIETLKITLLTAFCNLILKSFSNDEMPQVLEERKKDGTVSNIIWSVQIQTAYALNKEFVTQSVINRCDSMNEELIPEIANMLECEGISFKD